MDLRFPGELLDEETALAQSVFFFLAGFETSSTQLSMACYELAKNKDIQDKVRQDIQKHWNEGELTYEAINSMTYLDMVMAGKHILFLRPLTLQ